MRFSESMWSFWSHRSTNKGLRISFLLGKDSEASVLQFFRNSGFHQQHHGTAQFILHAVNTQHLCRGSLSYSLVWSGFTGCIELLITSKMVRSAGSHGTESNSSSYNKIVVFIDRSPAECYNSFRVLWIGEALLPQRRFLGGSNHSFFVEMLIS